MKDELYEMLAGALGVLLLVALLAVGVQTSRLKGAVTDLAKEQAAHQLDRANAESAARQAEETYRGIETTLRNQRDQAESQRTSERAAAARDLARVTGQLDGLRNSLRAYAAGGGGTADDSADACRARATQLGNLLEGYVRADAESTAELESQAADIRALLGDGRAIRQALKQPGGSRD